MQSTPSDVSHLEPTTPRRRAAWGSLALALALAALLSLALAPTGDAGRRTDLAFDDINPESASFGSRVAIDDLRAERGVVLQFIASWCEACREELPALEAAREGRRLPIVFVAADEYGAPDSLLIVAERSGLAGPILYVPEERVASLERHFRYEMLPATYVLDRRGKVRMSHEGAMPPASLVREMESALGI